MDDLDDFLAHHGVKGMKWGVRHDPGHEGESAKTRTIAKLDKKYDKSFSGVQGYIKVQNKVADKINPRLMELNKKPEYDVDMSKPENSAVHKKYLTEYEHVLEKSLNEAQAEFGSNASGTKRIVLSRYGNGADATWAANFEDIKHASGSQFIVRPKFNATGHIIGQTFEDAPVVAHTDDLDDFLAHHGVKGMHWGIRRTAEELGVSHKTARTAKKDAEEYTRAKAFYGEGAGTRRKLINATVTHRSKDAEYKKAFDHFVNNTDTAKRADQARSERTRKDVTNNTKKTVRGVKNALLGNPQYATATAIGLATAGKYAYDKGLHRDAVNAIKKVAVNRQNMKVVNDLLNGMGMKHAELEEGDTFDISDDGELMHYGVKGMRWGIRRPVGSDGLVEKGTTHVSQPKPGKKLKAAGGEEYPAHEDAIRAAQNKQIAKKSTTDALSTKDLQDLVNRMNLESQYHRLNPREQSTAEKVLRNPHFQKIALNSAGKGLEKAPDPRAKMAGKLVKHLSSQINTGGKKKK